MKSFLWRFQVQDSRFSVIKVGKRNLVSLHTYCTYEVFTFIGKDSCSFVVKIKVMTFSLQSRFFLFSALYVRHQEMTLTYHWRSVTHNFWNFVFIWNEKNWWFGKNPSKKFRFWRQIMLNITLPDQASLFLSTLL